MRVGAAPWPVGRGGRLPAVVWGRGVNQLLVPIGLGTEGHVDAKLLDKACVPHETGPPCWFGIRLFRQHLQTRPCKSRQNEDRMRTTDQ